MNYRLNRRRVQQGVVDQALVNRAQHAGLVAGIDRGRDDFDAERAQAGRLLGLVGRHVYFEFRAVERVSVQVLDYLETCAGAERD